MTQAQQLIQAIRRSRSKGMTYGELEALRISTCPWKRIEESGFRHLRWNEALGRKIGKDGLARFVIVNVELSGHQRPARKDEK